MNEFPSNYPETDDAVDAATLRERVEAAEIIINDMRPTLEAMRKDAEFMANVWKLYGAEFSDIVARFGGDPDGIDFVASRILNGGAS